MLQNLVTSDSSYVTLLCSVVQSSWICCCPCTPSLLKAHPTSEPGYHSLLNGHQSPCGPFTDCNGNLISSYAVHCQQFFKRCLAINIQLSIQKALAEPRVREGTFLEHPPLFLQASLPLLRGFGSCRSYGGSLRWAAFQTESGDDCPQGWTFFWEGGEREIRR